MGPTIAYCLKCESFQTGEGPCRGFLSDWEIFANLHLTFVLSSIIYALNMWILSNYKTLINWFIFCVNNMTDVCTTNIYKKRKIVVHISIFFLDLLAWFKFQYGVWAQLAHDEEPDINFAKLKIIMFLPCAVSNTFTLTCAE